MSLSPLGHENSVTDTQEPSLHLQTLIREHHQVTPGKLASFPKLMMCLQDSQEFHGARKGALIERVPAICVAVVCLTLRGRRSCTHSITRTSPALPSPQRSPFLLRALLPAGNLYSAALPQTKSGPNIGTAAQVQQSLCWAVSLSHRGSLTWRAMLAAHLSVASQKAAISAVDPEAPRSASAAPSSGKRRHAVYWAPKSQWREVVRRKVGSCTAGTANGLSRAECGLPKVRPLTGPQQRSVTQPWL